MQRQGQFSAMIYLVNNTIDGQGDSPREIADALGRVCPGTPVVMDLYRDVSLSRVQELAPSHIILSGQSHPWTDYTPGSLDGVHEVIKQAAQPILGICGGHQQVALVYGARVDVMKRVVPGTTGYDGCLKERGFYPVTHDGSTLFAGLPESFVVWHSHYDEVKDLPDGFTGTARSENCALQALQHKTRPLFTVQFHPELFNAENPAGCRVLENFLSL
jgi:GMP synthase (glutamine-hydrolysing)